ncbi:MAG: hypothetical protein LBF40_00730 [Deltaproteobacteria bacterium]|nr:hypothetical protein [Deltaproteobacteria bacterium]
MYRIVLLLVFGALLTCGCSDSRLDTSDASAFIKSVEGMYNDAVGKEREDFAKFFFIAMNGRSDLITLSQLKSEEIPRLGSFFNVLVSRKKPEEIQALHGMSAEDIVEKGRNLKITYLDGRIQELQREISTFQAAADYYREYSQESNKVNLSLASEAAKVVADKGKVKEIHIQVKVSNESGKKVVALGHDGAHIVLAHGGNEGRLGFHEVMIVDLEGVAIFENGGIPSSTEVELLVVADVSHLGWEHDPGSPVTVEYPIAPDPFLEGWEEASSAEDSFKRVYELERVLARLSRQMSETKA